METLEQAPDLQSASQTEKPSGSLLTADAEWNANGAEDSTKETNQYVSFLVRGEEYGIDIMAVREIKGWVDITRLPNAPAYVRGVLNLRGVMLPIFDLSQRFDQGETEATPLHVVIIVAACDRIIGILVDAVSDILSINKENIRPVPEMNVQVDEQYLTGLVTVEDRMVSLLNLEKLFNISELEEDSPTIAK